MIVRRLLPADWQDYRTIRLQALELAPEAFGSVHALEAARPAEAFAERLSSAVVMGAYAEGRIAGMAGYKRCEGPRDAHKAFVWGVFVAPDFQGHGVGQALIKALIAAARQEVEQLTLAVVASNESAIALYERNGFKTYGVEPRALKSAAGYEDEVLMAQLF
jgi:ribosomal protein S18 acetylase RimI-like enzyme